MVVVRNTHAKLDTIDSKGNVPIQNFIRLFHFSHIGIYKWYAGSYNGSRRERWKMHKNATLIYGTKVKYLPLLPQLLPRGRRFCISPQLRTVGIHPQLMSHSLPACCFQVNWDVSAVHAWIWRSPSHMMSNPEMRRKTPNMGRKGLGMRRKGRKDFRRKGRYCDDHFFWAAAASAAFRSSAVCEIMLI